MPDNKFVDAMANSNNKTKTLNNAETYKSTQNAVLDLFYLLPASRGKFNQILPVFVQAINEDLPLTMAAMFYTRDFRGKGQGERQLFRDLLKWLADNRPEDCKKIIPFVPEYGRWDDLFCIVKHPIVGQMVVEFISNQFRKDLDDTHPSLLGKWLPSTNTSGKGRKSRAGRELGMFFVNELGTSSKVWRKHLASLRAKIKIVERFMSANKWGEITYEHVPSKASLLYRKAFSRHDAERYVAYLQDVKKGTKKIKTQALYPYELVRRYIRYGQLGPIDETIELQWSNLPNYLGDDQFAMCVVDTSGSMNSGIDSHIAPIDVALSLGVYMADRARGPFAGRYITFSQKPIFQKLVGASLKEKLQSFDRQNWMQNTDLMAVFRLILDAAVSHNLSQEDLPSTLIIISDMEFDSANRGMMTNFEAMKAEFAAKDYQLPKIVFWNVNAKQRQTPVTQNDKGVYLVSGCSPTIFKAALNSMAVTPIDLMLEVLQDERYQPIIKLFQ